MDRYGCPTDDELAVFLDGAAGPVLRERVHDHVADCSRCAETLAAYVRGVDTNRPSSEGLTADPDGRTLPASGPPRATAGDSGLPHPPAALGRFAILRTLGVGGMGVVYAARDPQLDRTVALKVLHPSLCGAEAQQRLLREAQAMARLQHPNVLAVHEAGVLGDQVYLVLEHLAGGTLREWLRERPRGWREVLGMFVPAGRGLAAAHAVGLVHRDFKPANVLIGDGRVRISDFGLARSAQVTSEIADQTAQITGDLLLSPMTQPGAVLGTPAYMAPEQIRGEVATTHSDQFSFCVVLYEALYGHRPFEGATLMELLAAIERGAIVRPARRGSPRRLLAAIVRGLDGDPTRRFATMDALLAVLHACQTSRIRRLGVVGAASALVLGALAWLSTPPAGYTPTAPSPNEATAPVVVLGPATCNEQTLAGIWEPARRTAFAQALAGTVGAQEVDDFVNGYADRWTRMHGERCARGEAGVSAAAVCLEDRRIALADYLRAVLALPAEARALARPGLEFLPELVECEEGAWHADRVGAAMSPETRMRAWRLRLAMAPAFTRVMLVRGTDAAYAGVGFEAALGMLMGRPRSAESPRLALEGDLFAALLDLAPGAQKGGMFLSTRPDGQPLVASTGAPARVQVVEARLLPIARAAENAIAFDLAARAWTLAAELLETGPHGDDERRETWRGAEEALAKLAPGHRLRSRLHRDLGYVQLAHARHTTAPGACVGDGDFAACDPVFRAIDNLERAATATARDPSGPSAQVDRELLARAYEHAGDVARAAAARRGGSQQQLDEASLDYLDFSAGAPAQAVVPTPRDSLRCSSDFRRCEVVRALAEQAVADPEAFFRGGTWQFVGDELEFGITVGGSPWLVALGVAMNDRLVEVESHRLSDDALRPALARAVQRGRIALALSRGGRLHRLEIVLR